MEDLGFAARMLQKGLLVLGRSIRTGPLKICIDAWGAVGQSVRGGDLSGTPLCLTLKGFRDNLLPANYSLVTFLLLETRKLLA